ncbi:hypothetical protein Hanom_Chr11g01040181 [Helianthus anomalus]
MEGVLIECVQNSLRHLLYRNEGRFGGRFSGDGVGGFALKWWSAGYDRVRCGYG